MQYTSHHHHHRRHTVDISHLLETVGEFIKKNVVLCVALVAAAVSSIIVPPDAEYLSYFDLKTLTMELLQGFNITQRPKN